MFQRARYSPLIGSAFFKRSGGCAYIRLGEACLAGSRLEHPDRIDCETCCTPVFCDVVWESQQRRLPYGARLGTSREIFKKVARNEINSLKKADDDTTERDAIATRTKSLKSSSNPAILGPF